MRASLSTQLFSGHKIVHIVFFRTGKRCRSHHRTVSNRGTTTSFFLVPLDWSQPYLLRVVSVRRLISMAVLLAVSAGCRLTVVLVFSGRLGDYLSGCTVALGWLGTVGGVLAHGVRFTVDRIVAHWNRERSVDERVSNKKIRAVAVAQARQSIK